MKLIREEIESVKFLVETTKSGKKSLYIEGVFLQGNIKNRNGRMYPMETLRREVSRYNEAHVNAGRALGELGHPDGPTVNLDRVSHKIVSLKESGDNFIGKAKILGTPMGKIAANLVEEGVKLGVSSRGIGSLKMTREGCNLHLMLSLKVSWKEKSGFGKVDFCVKDMQNKLKRELIH